MVGRATRKIGRYVVDGKDLCREHSVTSRNCFDRVALGTGVGKSAFGGVSNLGPIAMRHMSEIGEAFVPMIGLIAGNLLSDEVPRSALCQVVHTIDPPKVTTRLESVRLARHVAREFGQVDVDRDRHIGVEIFAVNMKDASSLVLAATGVFVAPSIPTPWICRIRARSILHEYREVVCLDRGLGDEGHDSFWGCNVVSHKDYSSRQAKSIKN